MEQVARSYRAGSPLRSMVDFLDMALDAWLENARRWGISPVPGLADRHRTSFCEHVLFNSTNFLELGSGRNTRFHRAALHSCGCCDQKASVACIAGACNGTRLLVRRQCSC